jgi:hypothetical protein
MQAQGYFPSAPLYTLMAQAYLLSGQPTAAFHIMLTLIVKFRQLRASHSTDSTLPNQPRLTIQTAIRFFEAFFQTNNSNSNGLNSDNDTSGSDATSTPSSSPGLEWTEEREETLRRGLELAYEAALAFHSQAGDLRAVQMRLDELDSFQLLPLPSARTRGRYSSLLLQASTAANKKESKQDASANSSSSLVDGNEEAAVVDSSVALIRKVQQLHRQSKLQQQESQGGLHSKEAATTTQSLNTNWWFEKGQKRKLTPVMLEAVFRTCIKSGDLASAGAILHSMTDSSPLSTPTSTASISSSPLVSSSRRVDTEEMIAPPLVWYADLALALIHQGRMEEAREWLSHCNPTPTTGEDKNSGEDSERVNPASFLYNHPVYAFLSTTSNSPHK